MVGKKQELKETTNSTVYRRRYKEVVTAKWHGCTHCKWHRIENSQRKAKRGHRKLNKQRRRKA